MSVSRWWFTMLWNDPKSGWIPSPLHEDWGRANGGLFSKGYLTLSDAQNDWLQSSATSSLGFKKDAVSSFYLNIAYAPERPDYRAFALPLVVFYGLDGDA